ncbi:MAG: sigma-54 dependent transcriptional regulator [Bacteroides sp.]|nr:sigma-54 dependent transcriptional regulator [Roseburia sp.]MCM1346711.1 sigma-54 dependent transcriptional regulator [Bacteroides sp.]MCM1421464.1 sigma-54 dependent transcriptional regulator [Bacteroides sp.]
MDNNNIRQIKQRYGIIGNAEGLNRALNIAIQVASTDLSVLIVGESGVGKEVIPRIIHDNSARKHSKYFAINCGSIPEGTIDSELFGHAKGAFTGAVGEREGYFGAANKGTLFLDEVGELPLATQARLLRVLETGEYIRVGESEVRKTDVRIVAATNLKMQKAISEGRFREDLYYRLNTIPISLPPLRERGRDIDMLFRKFAIDISEKYSNEPVRLTDDAKELLLNYKWPGNIRQLKNITEQISVISEEREITKDILLQYGVTDDRLAEQGLVLVGGADGNGQNVSSHSYEAERDMLFQLLSSIGKEVKELKDMVHSNVSNMNNMSVQQTVQSQSAMMTDDYADLRQQITPGGFQMHTSGASGGSTYLSSPSGIKIRSNEREDVSYYDEAEQVVEEAPHSMKDMEKISIQQALERCRGKRKRAAAELGISERTLYRKIKEYGLD